MPRRERRPKCTYTEHCTIPAHGPCTLEHTLLQPSLENYEGGRWVITSKTLDYLLYSQLRDAELRKLTPNYKYFRGDSLMWSSDLVLLNDICLAGRAIQQLPSPEVTLGPDQVPLLGDTNIIRTNDDGSVVVQGQTGQCDNQASLFHADMIDYAIHAGMGFDFCSGFQWQYAPKGHSNNWCIDNDLRFKLLQVRSWGLEVIDPQDNPDLAIHLLYEA